MRFLLDEHLRGPLWRAILRHNLRTDQPLDVACVGDVSDLSFGATDATVLQWAEREHRILVTQDRRTMPQHLQRHLDSGNHSPGILMVRRDSGVRELLEYLVLTDQAADFADAVNYIP
jgi:hypothetical protein